MSSAKWHFVRNSYIFIQENAFENVVREMGSILSRPQCVNDMRHSIVPKLGYFLSVVESGVRIDNYGRSFGGLSNSSGTETFEADKNLFLVHAPLLNHHSCL